ncbi:MAG: glycosyltransferase [Saprospiraceae bacterium]|nr:glycosyltransferase [Saprospiraceae bacterium]
MISYTAVQLILGRYWLKIPISQVEKPSRPKASVIIAVRNESDSISACLRSVCDQTYPRESFEVIVVDNHSKDATLSICRRLQSELTFTLVDLSEMMPEHLAFKKEALSVGIERSSGEVILTTDGDCVVLRTWIESLVDHLTGSQMMLVTGPVNLPAGKRFLDSYQELELLGLMVVTGGGIESGLLLMANGANMGFYKETFNQLGGYQNLRKLASGDDVHLLHRFNVSRFGSIGFVKAPDAVVTTEAVGTISHLIEQRKRWASKATSYLHASSKLVALIVAANSFLLIVGGILALTLDQFLWIFVLQLALKILIDSWIVLLGASFVSKSIRPWDLLRANFLNPLVNIVIVCSSLVRKEYSWKGRVTK